jgi:hypothetical protein
VAARRARARGEGLACGLAAALLLLPLALPGSARALDLTLYAGILASHTREVPDAAGTRVDYRGLAGAPQWQELVRSLAASRPDALGSRAERLAFWINAYNVLAIDLAVRNQPLDDIRDIGSLLRPVWRREAGRIGGRAYTLHEIEHEILRPLGDPRIHAALVCASVSCPALRREPWTAQRLDEQFDDALARWLASPEKGLAIDRSAGVARVSRIFDWFEEDFGGRPGVLALLAAHAPPAEREWLRSRGDDLRLAWLDYDWSLNDLARAGAGE